MITGKKRRQLPKEHIDQRAAPTGDIAVSSLLSRETAVMIDQAVVR